MVIEQLELLWCQGQPHHIEPEWQGAEDEQRDQPVKALCGPTVGSVLRRCRHDCTHRIRSDVLVNGRLFPFQRELDEHFIQHRDETTHDRIGLGAEIRLADREGSRHLKMIRQTLDRQGDKQLPALTVH